MNKTGIELSINFLVGFILAITVFGLSVVFVYNIYGSAKDNLDVTQEQIDQQISDLFCSASDKVCISNNNPKIERGKFAAVGISAYNYHEETTVFEIKLLLKYDFVTEEGESRTVDETRELTLIGEPRLASNSATHVYSAIVMTDPVLAGDYGQVNVGIAPKKTTTAGTYRYDVIVTPIINGVRDDTKQTLRKLDVTIQ